MIGSDRWWEGLDNVTWVLTSLVYPCSRREYGIRKAERYIVESILVDNTKSTM